MLTNTKVKTQVHLRENLYQNWHDFNGSASDFCKAWTIKGKPLTATQILKHISKEANNYRFKKKFHDLIDQDESLKNIQSLEGIDVKSKIEETLKKAKFYPYESKLANSNNLYLENNKVTIKTTHDIEFASEEWPGKLSQQR